MRNLTEHERKEIEFARDMINGNINRMCTTDDIRDLYRQAEYAKHMITAIVNAAENRFKDHTKEVIE